MSADLHIHIVPNSEIENDVRQSFRQIMWDSKLGNVAIEYLYKEEWKTAEELEALGHVIEEHHITNTREVKLDYDEDAVNKTKNVWIGEVSWLKSMLFNDKSTYVPTPVQAIYNLIKEELPVLTEDLESKILDALNLPNSTGYSIAKRKDVKTFLDKHIGKKIFTISW